MEMDDSFWPEYEQEEQVAETGRRDGIKYLRAQKLWTWAAV